MTTEANEVAKRNRYRMNELPTLEVRLILNWELAVERGAEEDISAPPQKDKKGSARGSSVPPGSDTPHAKAREQGEAKKLQERVQG